MTEIYITPPGGSRAEYAVMNYGWEDILGNNQASTCSFTVPLSTPVTAGSHVIISEEGEIKFRGWCLDGWKIDYAARTRSMQAMAEEYMLFLNACPLYTYQIGAHRVGAPFGSDAPNQTVTGTAPAYTIGQIWWLNSGLSCYNWESYSAAQKCYKHDGFGYESRIRPTSDVYVDGRKYTHKSTIAEVLATPYTWTQDIRYMFIAPYPYMYAPVAADNCFESYVRLGAISDIWATILSSPLKVDPTRNPGEVLAKFAEFYSTYMVPNRTLDYTYIDVLDEPGRGDED